MSLWQKLFGSNVHTSAARPTHERTSAEPARAREASTADPVSASMGLATMIEVCSRRDLLTHDLRDKAIGQLVAEGPAGSRALSGLIRELLACRSSDIKKALFAASRVASTPEIVAALNNVLSADSLAAAPAQPRFAPQIFGSGKVGWDDGETKRVRSLAREAMTALGVRPAESLHPPAPEQANALPQAAAALRTALVDLAAARDFLDGDAIAKMKAVDPEEAAAVLRSLLHSDPDGKLGLTVVRVIDNGKLEPRVGVPIVATAASSKNPSTRNVSVGYLVRHDVPEAREIISQRLVAESDPHIRKSLEWGVSQWKQ